MTEEPVLLQTIGPRLWGRQPGRLRTLRQADLGALVRQLRDALVDRFGGPRLTAPHQDRRWRGQLEAALLLATEHDSPLPFASADFGPVLLYTASAQPVLWLWMSTPADRLWPTLLALFPQTAADPVDWSPRVPARPVLSTAAPRAALHWGEGASWREGDHALSFQAGLAARPPEIYLPPAGEWAERVPEWAVPLRDQVCRDFAALGARVVDTPGAQVACAPGPSQV